MKLKMHFKNIESYKHKLAKQVLKDWLLKDYLRIVEEENFIMEGLVWFIVDLACYKKDIGLVDLYEIVHKNEVSVIKQWKMFMFMKWHNWDVNIWRIDADWIMNQIGKPDYLNRIKIL